LVRQNLGCCKNQKYGKLIALITARKMYFLKLLLKKCTFFASKKSPTLSMLTFDLSATIFQFPDLSWFPKFPKYGDPEIDASIFYSLI